MNSAELLTDAFERVVENARSAADGLTPDQLVHRPAGHQNSIAWLLWHLTRVQDDHVSELAGTEQAWTAEGWHERFDLDLPTADTGYGHNSTEVDRVHADGGLLVDHLTAVTARTTAYLPTLSEADFDRVVDENWDPPVTLGARLISVVNDTTQHVGQAAYVRGLLAAE